MSNMQVGERGIQLSGGEKQRIAIARAIIRSPKILLLDEATSALDTVSELVVQEALETVAIGRTTITIAHRLSTIRKADTIFVLQSGQVVESGSHTHLISLTNGHYSHLVRLQQSQQRSYNPTSVGAANSSTINSYSHRNHNFNDNPNHCSSSSRNRVGDDMINTKRHAPSFWQLLLMNKPEWRHVALGCACAAFFGLPNLLYSYSISSILVAFHDKDEPYITTKTRAYCLILSAMSVLAFVIYVLKDYSFSIMGHHLTKRVRESMLSKILTFEVGWFDHEKNSIGAICSMISKDTRVVQSLVGDRLSLLVQTLSTILIAYAVGLMAAWKLAVVIISVLPLAIACYYVKAVLLRQLSQKGARAQSESSRLAVETIHNIRTVTAFSSQGHILRLFFLALAVPRRHGVRHAWLAGALLGASQCISHCFWALPIWRGGALLSSGSITVRAFFLTMILLSKTSFTVAEAAGAVTTDLANGISSAAVILSVLERETQIDPDRRDGHEANGDAVELGAIELRNVSFSYPSRPEALVLRRLSLSFEAGRSSALVGRSGSGKSTIIGLIERFYDPSEGEVRVDGRNIRTYRLRSLRRRVALVGQEPSLLSGTIKENILYGAEEASDAEVEAAARMANAHGFICRLKDGYGTSCGEKGAQLSCGQKQRVAIARAVLRNPSILLLDEATSALDGEAEKMVREALERAMEGKTTVVVAHRLGAVKNCDVIFVVEDGGLVEKGSHRTLMEMGRAGKYYGLVSLQLGQEK